MNINKKLENKISEYKKLGYSFWRESYSCVFGVIKGQENADSMIAIHIENGVVKVSK